MSRIRSRLLGLAGAAALASGAALAQSPPATTSVGAWDLALGDGSRQCRIMLRADLEKVGYGVGMPAGCRHAFPTLATIALWNEAGEGQIRLEDSTGETLVSFEAGADGVLTGTGPQGDVYHLMSVGAHRAVVLKAAAAPKASPPPAPAHAAPPPDQIAGHYAVLRDKARDTGCMVTLDDKAHGAKGTLKANLAPACRDQGIVIFDPVGWEVVGGRLVLTARKGHTAKFDLQDDGTWLKDPKDGKSLALKRI